VSAAIDLAGERLELRPSGAVWAPARAVLAAADLHLEKGSAFAARGQLLPPFDTVETLDRLEAEIAALSARTVVLLGDNVHDRAAWDRLDAAARGRLAALARRCEVIWIEGNHDPCAAPGIFGRSVAGLALGDLHLTHEPALGLGPGAVFGHLHPCARVQTRLGRVRRACFISDGARMVLPAFGAFTGGLNVRDPAFAGLFTGKPRVWALGAERVYEVAWGNLKPD
jgi:uncharacterized protein